MKRILQDWIKHRPLLLTFIALFGLYVMLGLAQLAFNLAIPGWLIAAVHVLIGLAWIAIPLVIFLRKHN